MNRRRRVRWALPGLLAMAGCFQGRTDQTAAGGRSSAQASTAHATVPEVVRVPMVGAPEDFLARITREFQVRTAGGTWERYREQLSADGQGRFRLDLLEYAPDERAQFQAPDLQQIAGYERRQRYLVHDRDVHVRDAALAEQNYGWSLQPATVTLAGRDCDVYQARSRHGFGTVELTVDRANHMLLGWALLDGKGNELQRVESSALDASPDLSGAIWSEPAANEQPYTGSPADLAQLGFTPLVIDYIPDGFALARTLILWPLTPGTPPLYLEVYQDGLQVLLIAQQAGGQAGGGIPVDQLRFARNASSGGISLVEGELGGRKVYLVSSLPAEELDVVLGSMR